MFSWVFIFYWISFEYSGYRASYFCYTTYIYIFIHIHQIYIYFGRFAAWITYFLITLQCTLFLAYKLKYRNFNFYTLHVCLLIFCYIRLLVWSASRGHKYFIICCILCMHFYEYSNTFNSTLFLYLCTLTIYMHTVRFALVLLLTYLLYSFMFFYKYSNSNSIISHICILTIYVCWALLTLHYLLMCYIPLSCFYKYSNTLI